jgi:hypothetical protein
MIRVAEDSLPPFAALAALAAVVEVVEVVKVAEVVEVAKVVKVAEPPEVVVVVVVAAVAVASSGETRPKRLRQHETHPLCLYGPLLRGCESVATLSRCWWWTVMAGLEGAQEDGLPFLAGARGRVEPQTHSNPLISLL